METIAFTLPEKAQQIIVELAKNELNQSSFMSYLAACCTHAGYIDAANYFHDQSRAERNHFDRWNQFLELRGVKPEMPGAEKPKVDFTDLKSGIRAAYAEEIAASMLYDKAYKELREVDSMAYIEVQGFINDQKWALKKLQEMWTIFSQLEGFEDQREAEVSYFCPPAEGIVN